MTVSVFLMRFFRYSVDEFDSYRNFTNAEFAILETNADGWLELRTCVRNESGVPEYCARARQPAKWQSKREMRYE